VTIGLRSRFGEAWHSSLMPSVDVVDEMFLVAPRSEIAAIFADPVTQRRIWPDLRLTVYADRGDEGLRWTVQGALVGTMEVWLEQVLDGTVLHYFLRADPPGPTGEPAPLPPKIAIRESRRRQLLARAAFFQLKQRLEMGREIGCPP